MRISDHMLHVYVTSLLIPRISFHYEIVLRTRSRKCPCGEL